MHVILRSREYSSDTILFHQAVGNLLGVNATDMKCLDMIMLNGSASPTQVSEQTGLTTGATTAMLDRLEKVGLIERHPHPKDRRATVLVLSGGAKRKLHELFESLSMAMEKLVSGYSEKQLEVLVDFFASASTLWKEERQKLMGRTGVAKRTRE